MNIDVDGGAGISSTGRSATLADFKQLSLLGEGAYSSVYKVLRLADREVYALKKIKLPSLSDKEKQNALNEIRLLASIQHENVIAYKEAFFDDKTRCLCIVQECADAGDLLQQINKCKQDRTYLREADVWRYLGGMCHGLKALHDLRILHRDMKCANVFLSNGPQGTIAKLGDFNVSKVAKRGLCMTQTGTPYYASPEVWRDMPYDAKSDMWSLGCVLYEMVALRPPFRAEDMEGLYRKVVRGQYPRIPTHYTQDLAEVIAALLQVHPRHRPSVDQLLQMPTMARNVPGLARLDDAPGRASDLLSTIKLPKNAIDLSGCLPKPRYDMPQKMPVIPMDTQDTPSSASVQDSAIGRRRGSDRDRGSSERRAGSGAPSPMGAYALPTPPYQRLGSPSSSPRPAGDPFGDAAGAAKYEDRPSQFLSSPARPSPQYQQASPSQVPAQSQLLQPPYGAGAKDTGDALDAYLLERTEQPSDLSASRAPQQQQQQQQQGRYRGRSEGPDTYDYYQVGGGSGNPTINPRYAGPPAYAPPPSGASGSGLGSGRLPREPAPRSLEPRRPMSIYARQQYTATESPTPAGVGSTAVSAEPARQLDSGGASRQRSRRLLPRIF